MDDLRPGHYWKTPFVWEDGCPDPKSVSPLRFEVAEYEWLKGAVAQAMASSMDEQTHLQSPKEVRARRRPTSLQWLRSTSTCSPAGGVWPRTRERTESGLYFRCSSKERRPGRKVALRQPSSTWAYCQNIEALATAANYWTRPSEPAGSQTAGACSAIRALKTNQWSMRFAWRGSRSATHGKGPSHSTSEA
jgi:hypothetical protein